MRLRSILMLFVLFGSFPSYALAAVRGFARLGGDFGGDSVIQFRYSDGTTPDITAGSGLLLSAGVTAGLAEFPSGTLDALASIGYKYRTIPPAVNQTASWSRFPVEALLLYHLPMGLRFGAGATIHFGNALSASGGVANGKVEFKNSPGYVLQAEYLFNQKWSMDLRYTILTYELSSGAAGKVNANSFGLGFSLFFGPA